MKKLWLLVLIVLGTFAGPASANWSSDWASREKITINTSDSGVAIKAPVENAQVLVRLHTGNFAFTDAKQDGSDLRFIAADDKTPLKFHIEHFDSLTELAVIWVTVPKITPGAKDAYIWMYYNNPNAAPASDPKTSFDANDLAVLHFDEASGLPKDSTAYGNNPSASTAQHDTSGLIGSGVIFDGTQSITIAPSSSLHVGANGLTVSMWIKPAGPQSHATLFQQEEGSNKIDLVIDGDSVHADLNGTATPASPPLAAGSWHHVALVAKDSLIVYVDGQQVAQASATLPTLAGTVEIGPGFKGELDEFRLANTARDPDYLLVEAQGQGADQKLLGYAAAEGGAESGGTSYFRILLSSVTVDGWVVIGILMVMMVISFTVMVTKGVFITRAGRANADFKEKFAALGADLTALAGTGAEDGQRNESSMYRVYHVGVGELKKRLALYLEKKRGAHLSAASIDAIRASLDAALTREMQRLNAQMVLLTIAISGGPFLGLLGTVVGVMITFAAIAAAGDVNVNSIAPGIAAALVATVAGLGVAIPSLFGYNYLASRIKELSTDMQVFVDEFVTRLAENYSE